MFKKHKFQKTEYPTNLDKNRFYENFDDSFRKILKRRKLTKEFVELLEDLDKHGYGNGTIVANLRKDQGVEDILRWIGRLSSSSILDEHDITTFKKIGESNITYMLYEYTIKKITNHIK